MEYALDKFRLCRLSPTPLTEQDAILFLINGLAKWEHFAAMTAAASSNIPAFIARIQQLEQLGVSERADVAPNRQMNIPPPQHPDLAAAFNNFSEKLVAELATKLESLTVSRSVGRGRGGTPDAARPPSVGSVTTRAIKLVIVQHGRKTQALVIRGKAIVDQLRFFTLPPFSPFN